MANSKEDYQRVLDKQQADKKKQAMKRLFQQIDANKSGCIKQDVFTSILSLQGIIMGPNLLNKVFNACRPTGVKTGDMVKYKEALSLITINMEIDQPLMKEWIVRTNASNENRAYSTIATSVGRTAVASTASLRSSASNAILKNFNGPIKAQAPISSKLLEK